MHQTAIAKGLPFGALSRDVRLILACNTVGSFGDGLYAYLLPKYVTDRFGASAVEVGVLYAVLNLSAALTLLVAGMLADKYDRKKIMIVGWIMWLPAPLIFAFAESWIQMLPGMILWGFWLGGPTTTAYVVSMTDKTKLTSVFTTISAGWSIGYIFSPALGGYVAGIFGMQIVFLAATALYATACAFLTFIRSQHVASDSQYSPEKRLSFLGLLKTKKLLKLSVFFGSVMFLIMMFRPFVPRFLGEAYGFDDVQIGILGSVSFASSAVLGILLGRLGDKSKKSYALSISMIFGSISLILLLLFRDFWILVIAFFWTGGSYITWSLMSAIVGPLAPESHRARWTSIPQTISMFASFTAPYVGGVLYSISSEYPFAVAAAGMFAIALVASTASIES